MSHGVNIAVYHRTLSALSQRLLRPLRVRQTHVFQRATVISNPHRGISNSSKMSGTKEGSKTFVLEEYNNVSVATSGLPKDTVQDLTKDELKEWSPFKNWITTLAHSLALQSHASHPDHKDPYKLHNITINSYTRFTNKRIGFLKLTANISKTNHPNITLPGTIFLRGPSVAMLIVLLPDDEAHDHGNADAHVLLTVQPRIATGSLAFVELPAGMMDADNNFAGKAAQEIEEELGLVIKEEELTCLTDKVAEIKRQKKNKNKTTIHSDSNEGETGETLPFAMYPSAGGCDEYIKIFAHEKRVSVAQLREWQGKLTGLREEGEMITLKVVPLEELWLEGGMDAKALAALTMYTQVKEWEKRKGKNEQKKEG